MALRLDEIHGTWADFRLRWSGKEGRRGIMPAPLKVDREAVRVLVVAIGPRAAARELGLPEATVQAWSARGGWLDGIKPIQALPASMVSATVATKSPSDAMADVLADHERETKLSLAITARRNAVEAQAAGLAGASEALLTGKLAALVHGWQSNGAGTTVQVSVGLRLEMD